MREGFRTIYGDLVALYGRTPFDYQPVVWPLLRREPPIYPPPVALLVQAIDQGIRQSDLANRVREDARLFLLVNFGELVLKPLLHPRAPGRRDAESVAAEIRTDTTTIVRAAGREVTGDRLVTAAETLRAVPRVYDDLKIKSSNIQRAA